MLIKHKLKSYEQKLFDITDFILTWRHFLILAFIVGVGVLILYFLNINLKGKIEHVPTYLFFGIITVFGFLLGYRILFYVRPVVDMEQYVKYLTTILKDTTPQDELIILASTPNPGLRDYLESNKDQNHYYRRYVDALDRVKNYSSIQYRVLPYDQVRDDGTIELKDDSPMMQFLQPFLRNLKNDEMRNEYKTMLRQLLENIKNIVIPEAPLIKGNNKEAKSKGILIIYHPRMGFIGVYDATGGILKIRGVRVGESVFLGVLKDIVQLME